MASILFSTCKGKREGGDEDAVYAEQHTENARRWREYTPCAGARSKCGVIAAATWSGAPVSFNHVDQVVRGRVWLTDGDVGIADTVFTEYSLDLVVIDIW